MDAAAPVETVCRRYGGGQRSTAWRIVPRSQHRYQALRLWRTAARLRDVDGGATVERLA